MFENSNLIGRTLKVRLFAIKQSNYSTAYPTRNFKPRAHIYTYSACIQVKRRVERTFKIQHVKCKMGA